MVLSLLEEEVEDLSPGKFEDLVEVISVCVLVLLKFSISGQC